MRVLQIEDDGPTARTVELMLACEGVSVTTTDLGEDGAQLAQIYDYDVVLLELTLPDVSGLAALRAMRLAKVRTPVLVVTGDSRVDTKVRALNAGADDYLTKPYHKDELVARIHALARRARGHVEATLEVGNLVVHMDRHTATVDGRPVHLTGKEYQLVELLALRCGLLLTKESILTQLYDGRDEPDIKIVDVFVCKVRKKLAAAGSTARIHTTWGRGYHMTRPPLAQPAEAAA